MKGPKTALQARGRPGVCPVSPTCQSAPVYCHKCRTHNRKNTNTVTYHRIFSKTNINTFENEIKDICWNEILNETDDQEKAYNQFLGVFLDIYEANFLIKQRKNSKTINKDKSPWITNCILKSVRTKNKLYKTYLMNPTDKNEQIYKKYKNKLNHVIKTAKKKYYESLLIKHKQNSRIVWKTLNEILNKPNKNTNISKTFIQTNSTDVLDNPKEIANKFNHYFVNVGPNLASKVKQLDNNSFDKYLKGNYQSSFFLNPITEHELELELKNTNSNKSCGYDGISTNVLKIIAKEISKPLTHIFNLTFSNGIIPDKLKIALVTPIFKGNERNKCENYRPISVLNYFSKLIEKLMTARLTKLYL